MGINRSRPTIVVGMGTRLIREIGPSPAIYFCTGARQE